MRSTHDALIGQGVACIDTPAACIDLDAMERNIARMADFAHQHQMRWRPHAKLHKSAALALLLEQAGAHGHCVQKTSEAEALAAGGVRDLFISNEVIAPHKLCAWRGDVSLKAPPLAAAPPARPRRWRRRAI